MNFQDFIKNIECKTQLYMGKEYEICIQKVTKNNGVELTGIMAKKEGASTFPTIYIDDLYEENMTMEDVEYAAMKLSRNLSKVENNLMFDIGRFTNYELAKDRIALKLINADKNKALLFEIPHRRFHNLAIVYYYLLPEELSDGIASVLIRNTHMENWGIDEKTLYEIAYENSRQYFKMKVWTMGEMISELYGSDLLEEDFPMYVISNENKINGSFYMIYEDELKQLSDKFGKSFYILPSSIHELILMPDDGNKNEKDLLCTVTEINHTQVQDEEILADSVYYYDKDKNEVYWLC